MKPFWGYKAPPTPEYRDLPIGAFNGIEQDWNSLSPGMRREIYRQLGKEAIKRFPKILLNLDD